MADITGLENLEDDVIEDLFSSSLNSPEIIQALLFELFENRDLDIDGGIYDLQIKAFVRLSLNKVQQEYLELRQLSDPDSSDHLDDFSSLVANWLGIKTEEPVCPEPPWPWPISEPAPSGGGRGPIFTRDHSGLWISGYRSGANGMSDTERRDFLNYFFRHPLPDAVSEYCGDEYGEPGSELRLQKMANVIAVNCCNFKRNDRQKYQLAIRQWEMDLRYLKDQFYVAGSFPWPPIEP